MTAFENQDGSRMRRCVRRAAKAEPIQMHDLPVSTSIILPLVRSLARIVSMILRWRAWPDDGEHSGG